MVAIATTITATGIAIAIGIAITTRCSGCMNKAISHVCNIAAVGSDEDSKSSHKHVVTTSTTVTGTIAQGVHYSAHSHRSDGTPHDRGQ